MMTDPIADMLSRIRNAGAAGKSETLVPKSNLKLWIAKILEQEGYLASVEVLPDGFGMLRLVLKYEGREPMIRAIHRVSKPGRRVYADAAHMPRVHSDLGIAVVSTSAGVMTNKEARRRKLGGEILCEIS